MSKREDALEILKSLGLPRQQQNERSCLTLLALAGLSEPDPWSSTKRPALRIWDMMNWMDSQYGKKYAPNSRETVRRQTIQQFEQARLVDRNPDRPSTAIASKFLPTIAVSSPMSTRRPPHISDREIAW